MARRKADESGFVTSCNTCHHPHLQTSPPPFSPSLLSRTVSEDVKHHVYLLTERLFLNPLLIAVLGPPGAGGDWLGTLRDTLCLGHGGRHGRSVHAGLLPAPAGLQVHDHHLPPRLQRRQPAVPRGLLLSAPPCRFRVVEYNYYRHGRKGQQ